MDAILKRLGVSGGQGLLGTRRGTMIVAAVVALFAAVLLVAFLNHYRKTTNTAAAVLVADRLIPKGTSGDIVASDQFYRPTSVASDQAKDGAVADASAIAGKVAVRDVYPGQQITADDFAKGADSVRAKLTGTQRAISIPLDGAHGLVGQVRAGDHVDVLAGFNASTDTTGRGEPVLRTLVRDVLVLQTPEAKSSSSGVSRTSNIVVRVDDKQAAELAFAADNGKVWFIMRPPAGASDSGRPRSISMESLLSNSGAIQGGVAR